MATKSWVYIIVSGGEVQEVLVENGPGVSAEIVNLDNSEDAEKYLERIRERAETIL